MNAVSLVPLWFLLTDFFASDLRLCAMRMQAMSHADLCVGLPVVGAYLAAKDASTVQHKRNDRTVNIDL